MHIFLTSLPYGEYRIYKTEYKGFNPENGFAEAINKVWKPGADVLFVASEPDNFEMTDMLSGELKARIQGAGLDLSSLTYCDHRNCGSALTDINRYDAVFLSGGHVPTTNDFYKEIELRKKLEGYDGIVVGISSGSMNSAETVYAQPELAGESSDGFVRFRNGLGLVNFSVIPHYQVIKNDIVDGKRLFEDITYKDSAGKKFYLFIDGTYAYKEIRKNGSRILFESDPIIHGEAYILADGNIVKICDKGGEYIVKEER